MQTLASIRGEIFDSEHLKFCTSIKANSEPFQYFMVVKYNSEVFCGFSSILQSHILKNIALLFFLHPWKRSRTGWMGL